MKSSRELKRLARENLAGKYRIAMGALLFSYMIPLLLEFPFSSLISGPAPTTTQYIIYYAADVLIAILAGVVTIGNSSLHLKIARNQEVISSHVFFAFKNQTDRYIIGYFIYFLISLIAFIPSAYGMFLFRTSYDNQSTFIALGLSILSLVLELLVSLFYGLVFYLLVDFQDLTVLQCFSKSRELMRGKKGRYFYITLSFIGLELVSLLSLGIGLLWVEPYKQQTYSCFYRNAIGELFDEYV